MNIRLQLPGTEMLWRSEGPSLRDQIARERHVLARIADGVALSEVLHELLADIEASAKSRMRTSILELSADGQRLQHLAAPSLPEAYCRAIDGVRIGEGVGSCGTAMYRGTPVYVADIAADPLWDDYRHVALPHDLRACWSTPIKGMDGTILGSFAIYYDAPRSPMPRDLEAISGITLTVALAIERHRAACELRRLRDELIAVKAEPGPFR
jgi:GAF domain-containing protein